MPNYIVPISELCYEEFQKIKEQLKIKPNVWSDSEILKMIFEKINMNKEFIKELQSIGKTTRGRSIHVRNNSYIDNVEYLTKCPECEFKICMLKHSLTEVIRIEMHSHFDNSHNKTGFYQCQCNSTFDWMPAFLRHINICDVSSYHKTMEKFSDPNNEAQTSKPDKTKLQINDNGKPECKSLESRNLPQKPLVTYKNSIVDNVKPIINVLPKIVITPKTQIEVHEDSLSNFKCDPERKKQPNLPINQSVNQVSLIKLTCQCLMVFDNYNEYQSHTLNCELKIKGENKKNSKLDSHEVIYSKAMSKNLLKDLKPNSDGFFPCPSCHKFFHTLVRLKQHFNGMHLQDTKKKCPKCNKLFRWLTSYKYHTKKCF